MPNFNVCTDIDVDIVEFVDSCDEDEIKELIEHLVDEGHISKQIKGGSTNKTFAENDIEDKLTKIAHNILLLTEEESQLIEKIANRF